MLYFSFCLNENQHGTITLRIMENNIALFFSGENRLHCQYRKHEFLSLLAGTSFSPELSDVIAEDETFRIVHRQKYHSEDEDAEKEHFHIYLESVTPTILTQFIQQLLAEKNHLLKTINQAPNDFEKTLSTDEYDFISVEIMNECLSEFSHYYQDINQTKKSSETLVSAYVDKWLRHDGHSQSFFERLLSQVCETQLRRAKSEEDFIAYPVDDIEKLFNSELK